MTSWIALASGWALAAFLLAACAMLVWTLLHERKESQRLRAENKTLLATALEARGVMYVNPEEPRQMREVPVSRAVTRKVAGKLIALEERDRRIADELRNQAEAKIRPPAAEAEQ